ncbi:hypothetical protein [Pelagerythrobacter marinus]|jgi:hypothetical protein|nr:hypothetical protein [Pelagerythrobacter marinus]QFT77536.1 hypothetical protein FIU90_08300 [Erythrobacter sp. THAF29]WBY15432.1 hypothetical protein PF049_07335 [Erythrobacteraceae bacterium WH01K]WPZ05434.1 hypothetical protein T8T98_08305 [Pelagerythrobacter marinus]|tara:strand:+ start:229 stop:369 length:141 start_codon:yes stop_codon:yes gene_type:complete
MVLMRIWPDSDDPLPGNEREWKLKLEAWLLGIPIVLMLIAGIGSLF